MSAHAPFSCTVCRAASRCAFVFEMVDFVQHLYDRFAGLQRAFGYACVFVVKAPCFANLDDDVHIVHALPGGAVHVAVDGFFALVDAGGINEDDLFFAFCPDAEQGMTGGLRFFRGDGDFLPDQVVNQCGFADVGAADNGDVAGFAVHGTPLFGK